MSLNIRLKNLKICFLAEERKIAERHVDSNIFTGHIYNGIIYK